MIPGRGLTNHAAILLSDGRVGVFGGYEGFQGIGTNGIFTYDPTTDIWQELSLMQTWRFAHTVTRLLDARALIVGGITQFDVRTEIYDSLANGGAGESLPGNPISVNRRGHTATLLLNGDVLIVGGQTVDGSATIAQSELFNHLTGTWTNPSSLMTDRTSHTATLLPSGQVLVVGGYRVAGGVILQPYLTSAEFQ